MLIGPVLGPMVICGVCFLKQKLDFLQKVGVKDSKKLSPAKRHELAKIIIENCYSHKIKIIDVKEIDNREDYRITLNRLEVLKFADLINELKPSVVILDAADVKEERFGASIKTLLNYFPKKIISKHKADDLFPIVSASSIIAKYTRDNLINTLKKKYGDFGSGYPSDTKTVNFLREWIINHKEPPFFARKTWDTTRRLLDEIVYNKKITDYYS